MDYYESDMPATAPYQVQLDDGDLIYVPSDIDELCRKLDPAWWEAIFCNGPVLFKNLQVLSRLLSQGRPPNVKDHLGDTLLLSSLRMGWTEGARAALLAGADPNLGSTTFVRPLHNALRVGPEAVLMLLEARADPNLQDKDPEKDPDYMSSTFEERPWHRAALHYAATRSAELCVLLLDHGADVRALDAHYKQPLHLAIEAGKLDVVDLLLSRRADPDAGNTTIGLTSTPLIDAAYRHDRALVRMLAMHRADVNRQGKQGMTALHMAARGRDAQLALLLLALGADPSLTASGKTVAELAMVNGDFDLAAKMGAHLSPQCPLLAQLDEAARALLCID